MNKQQDLLDRAMTFVEELDEVELEAFVEMIEHERARSDIHWWINQSPALGYANEE